jgi:ABC-type methionine transport system ATPase subunit
MDIWNANELINDEAIEALTPEQIEQILTILKNI